jgi:hypothetical protein
MWIQAPEERIRRALNRETKDEGPSATTGTTSVTGKDLEENSMKEDFTKSTSTSSSFERTVTPQPIVLEGPAMLSESQAQPQLSTLNPGNAVAIPPNQQPPASLPLSFGADVQSVPGTSLNPAPLQLSTPQSPLQLSNLNSGSAEAIPPIQQPPLAASLPLPFGPDVQSVPRTTTNPAPLQLSSLNLGIQQPPASLPLPFGADVLSVPGPLGVNFQPIPSAETATANAHHLPFNFPATGWVGSVPSPFTSNSNNIPIPAWDFSETTTKTDMLPHRTEWGNIGESFSFTDFLNAPVNNSNGSNIPACSDISNFLSAPLAVNNALAPLENSNIDNSNFMITDMSVSPNFNLAVNNAPAPRDNNVSAPLVLPQVPHSSDKENSEVIQVPTNLSSAENGNPLEKENEGLERASRSRRPTTSKEITAVWRESAYTYFTQELDSEEWNKCIDLWLEFEKNEESGLETNSVSIYLSL